MSKRVGEREQLSLFRALPGSDMALRDAQDLMAYPFFSLAKSPRIVPIRFEAGGISLTVEGVPEHGIATIWDADVLIWAASQIIQAKKEGIAPSRLMVATPYEILRFAQRGTGRSDCRPCRHSVLLCDSWQELHPRPLDQLLVADGPANRLPLPVLLPMRPGFVARGVIDQLVQIGRYLHPIGANARPRVGEYRPGDHKDIPLGPEHIVPGVPECSTAKAS